MASVPEAAARQASAISDYRYEEDVANAYLSLRYATDAGFYVKLAGGLEGGFQRRRRHPAAGADGDSLLP